MLKVAKDGDDWYVIDQASEDFDAKILVMESVADLLTLATSQYMTASQYIRDQVEH